jgi:hypothetical protein
MLYDDHDRGLIGFQTKMPPLKFYEINWMLEIPSRDSTSISPEMLERASAIKRLLTERSSREGLVLSPLERYVSLHEAIVTAHSPHVGFKNRLISEGVKEFLGSKDNNLRLNQNITWRITWDELIIAVIPDEHITEFCGLLFAATLLSMVRYWEVFDVPKGGWSPFDYNRSTGLSDEIRIKNPLAAPNYEMDFRFDSCLESCLHPVYGILSSTRFVLQPQELPSRVLKKLYTDGADRDLIHLFKTSCNLLCEECERQVSRSLDAERGRRLLERYTFHLEERYGI